VKLRQPFEHSLKEKQQLMAVMVDAVDRLVGYGIPDTTAAATYLMAETYFDFSRSLVESERPTGLAPAELEEFETVLDEEAFPFEERAIGVHEKNMELLHTGVLNDWTKKSLARLAELMPGRYDKREVSSGFVGAFDGYAPPAAPAPALDGATAEPESPAVPKPGAGGEGAEEYANPQ
jgi:hypothetical protein